MRRIGVTVLSSFVAWAFGRRTLSAALLRLPLSSVCMKEDRSCFGNKLGTAEQISWFFGIALPGVPCFSTNSLPSASRSWDDTTASSAGGAPVSKVKVRVSSVTRYSALYVC